MLLARQGTGRAFLAVSVTSRSQGHKAGEKTEEWSVIFLIALQDAYLTSKRK